MCVRAHNHFARADSNENRKSKMKKTIRISLYKNEWLGKKERNEFILRVFFFLFVSIYSVSSSCDARECIVVSTTRLPRSRPLFYIFTFELEIEKRNNRDALHIYADIYIYIYNF